MSVLNAPSRFQIFPALRADLAMRPVPKETRIESSTQRQMRQVAIHEDAAMKQLKRNKHVLYTQKLPAAGLLGTITYLLWTTLNSSTGIVKDFVTLMNSQDSILDEIRGIFKRSATQGVELGDELKGSLAQLRETLMSGNSPIDAARYMDGVREHAAGKVHTANLDNALQDYVATTERIFKNKKGLQAIAGEPMVLKLMGVSKKTAQSMAIHDREQFMRELFGKVLTGVDVSVFRKVFSRLDEVHARTARLISMAVSIGLAGYFMIDNELKTTKIAKGAA